MSAKNTVEVAVGGKIIHVSGYESEDYLQQVAHYLNHKLNDLTELPGYRRMPSDRKSLLLSLNIADDYFKTKQQAEVFEEDLEEKDKEMYALKQQIVELQVELDKVRKAAQQNRPHGDRR